MKSMACFAGKMTKLPCEYPGTIPAVWPVNEPLWILRRTDTRLVSSLTLSKSSVSDMGHPS